MLANIPQLKVVGKNSGLQSGERGVTVPWGGANNRNIFLNLINFCKLTF